MFRLDSDSLLSKFGFNDGDMPEDVCDRIDRLGIPSERVDWHAVLRNLVRKYLLPELAKYHVVELTDIDTAHNPIRAWKVDGVEVREQWYGGPVDELTPEGVDVPMSAVVEEIRHSLTDPQDDDTLE